MSHTLGSLVALWYTFSQEVVEGGATNCSNRPCENLSLVDQ